MACPDIVVAVVDDEVRYVMLRVARIWTLSTLFSRMLADASATLIDIAQRRLAELNSLIPEPPVISPQFYTDLLTCPLTPFALTIDPTLLSTLDPRAVVTEVQQLAKHYRGRIETYYDLAITDVEHLDPRPLAEIFATDTEALAAPEGFSEFLRPRATTVAARDLLATIGTQPTSQSVVTPFGPESELQNQLADPAKDSAHRTRARLQARTRSNNVPIRMARRYMREVMLTLSDPLTFSVRFARAALAVQTVKQTLPGLYASPAHPYRVWDDTVRGFNIQSNGEVIAGIPGQLRPLYDAFLLIELKLYRWQAFTTAKL